MAMVSLSNDYLFRINTRNSSPHLFPPKMGRDFKHNAVRSDLGVPAQSQAVMDSEVKFLN